MLAPGALGLRWPEPLAPTIDVDRRPLYERGPGVEVDVLPRQTQHLGHPPPLEEQQRHSRTEPMIPGGGEQRRVSSRSNATASASVTRSGFTDRTGFPTSAIFTASSTTWASVWRWWRTVRGARSIARHACHSVITR